MGNKRGLLLVPSDRMGGAERILKLVAMELMRRDWELDILCLSRGDGALFSKMASDRNCCVYVLSETREIFGVLGAFRLFFSKLRRREYELSFSSLIHCNAFLSFLRGCGLLRTNRLVCRESTIIANRFTATKRLYYWVCYLFYGAIDLVICQTREMENALPEFASFIDRGKLRVLPNPVGVTSCVRACRNIGADPTFAAFGRLIYEKGFDILLDAFSLLLKKMPAARLKIYGEGPLRGELLRHMQELELGGSVSFCGVTSAPLEAMAQADVCVVSSVMEGFPNVLLEMMQVNCRVVSTVCADGIDDIQGLLTCPTRDPARLSEAMQLAIRAPAGSRGVLFDAELGRRTPANFVDSMMVKEWT